MKVGTVELKPCLALTLTISFRTFVSGVSADPASGNGKANEQKVESRKWRSFQAVTSISFV